MQSHGSVRATQCNHAVSHMTTTLLHHPLSHPRPHQSEEDAYHRLRQFPEDLEQPVCVLAHGATGGIDVVANSIIDKLSSL